MNAEGRLRSALRRTRSKRPGLDVLDGGPSTSTAGEADVSSVCAHGRWNIDCERLGKGLIRNRIGQIERQRRAVIDELSRNGIAAR